MNCEKCGETVEVWQTFHGIVCTQCLYSLFFEYSAQCKHKQYAEDIDDSVCTEGLPEAYTDESGNDMEGYPVCGDYCNCPRQEEFFDWVVEKYSDIICNGEKMVDFGKVLEALKQGHTAERPNWKKNGIFIFLCPEREGSIKLNSLQSRLQQTDGVQETAIMRWTSRGTAVPYALSQQDVLAEDWTIVLSKDPEEEKYHIQWEYGGTTRQTTFPDSKELAERMAEKLREKEGYTNVRLVKVE